MLYALEVGKHSVGDAISDFWEYYEPIDDGQTFAEMIVRGTMQNLDRIDLEIQEISTHWKITRMACVDRNILRMAAFELQHVKEVPKRVTLNEAIEIAKRYGAIDSWAFINGILDKLAENVD